MNLIKRPVRRADGRHSRRRARAITLMTLMTLITLMTLMRVHADSCARTRIERMCGSLGAFKKLSISIDAKVRA